LDANRTPARARIESIDLVRGVVMVVMLIDHMRDFLHRDGLTGDPLDPASTTLGLYATRWITHLCAPTFVFLAGVSAHLQLQRGLSKAALTRFLISRGLFLVALELLVLRPLIWFQLDLRLAAFLQVIWVIGWSMVILAGLIHAPRWLIALFGFALVCLHNTLDGITVGWPANSFGTAIWTLLHQKNAIQLGSGGAIAFVQYPLIPWCGVMALGYLAGRLFDIEPRRRRRALAGLGVGALALFFVLRTLNVYGDLRPWSVPRGVDGEPLARWRAALSFFNVEKYPPSLLYLAVTLGLALLALAALDGKRFGRLGQALITFGRVPLFFYVLQWPMVHFTAWFLQAVNGQPLGWDIQSIFNPQMPPGAGFGLPGVFLGWAIGTVVLYPVCAAFAAYKRRNRAVWLSYL
jgi:uncharacterized membrane protein